MPARWYRNIPIDVVASLKVELALLFCATILNVGCDKIWPTGTKPAASTNLATSTEPADLDSAASRSSSEPAVTAPVGTPPAPDASADAGVAAYTGPWLTVLVAGAAVYAQPNNEKEAKIGYVQSGARLAVMPKPKSGDGCPAGWFELVDGGFICGASGTLDEKDARTHFALRPPNLDSLLPYTYARNTKNGTPMYRTVPTRDEMKRYEPYLASDSSDAKAITHSTDSTEHPVTSAVPTAAASVASAPTEMSAAAAASVVPSTTATVREEEDPKTPWWQREGVEDRLHEMKLSDLRTDSDDVLAQRMVKGFYVAVDRTFRWNGRTWYKTTKHMVVPADRFGVAGPSDFKGIELGTDWQLPVAWVYGGRESATLYEIDPQQRQPRAAGKLDHFEAAQLTSDKLEINSTTYLSLKNGKWVKQSQVRITAPGEPPEGLKPNERWLDVNLTQQTLVAFEGQRAVFATLISTGKSTKVKEKDHSTPVGRWRIREKHVTTTMDGDGTAAGDLPYSIEDVPYVMYFFRSYAVHGAFWHRNYGVQMSHGCVNLAPLDAKRLFFFTTPTIPSGWHGVWSSNSRPGSWVVVHE